MPVGLGHHFMLTGTSKHGSHTTQRYALEHTSGFVRDAALATASAYVSRKFAVDHPARSVAPHLPTTWTVRLGDFTEIVTRYLLGELHGRHLPLHKLHVRVTPDATIQGPDHLSVLLSSPFEAPIPELIECKGRSGRLTVSGLLTEELERELDAVDALEANWVAALRELELMPHAERSHARHLAQLFADQDSESTLPQLGRHVVALCEDDGIDADRYWEKWPERWTSADLFVVTLPDLASTIEAVFAAASELSFGDVADLGTAAFASGVLHAQDVGHQSPVDRTAVTLRAADFTGPERQVVESALWMLADHDGMGLAAAAEVLRLQAERTTSALASLLTGRVAVREAADLPELVAFCEAVRNAWHDPNEPHSVIDAGDHLAEVMTSPQLDAMVRFTSTAVAYRLHRHPRRLLRAPPGPATQRVLDAFAARGVQALWPGQQRVLEAGLLDTASPAFVVEMPTSAGKTALIELFAGHALDQRPDGVVVVLCPTRALVDQQRHVYEESFGEDRVVGLHGGYDIDTTDTALDEATQIVVMTPERFDRERRKARDGAFVHRIVALVVDEAHMLDDSVRGARLELLLSSFRQITDARIALISSHLGDVGSMLEWLAGEETASARSNWRPTPLRRGVFYPTEDWMCVRWDHDWDAPEQMVRIQPRAQTQRTEANLLEEATIVTGASMRAQLAAVGLWAQSQGMTMVAVTKRSSVEANAEEIAPLVETTAGASRRSELAAGIEALDPTAARLLRAGVGVHRRGLAKLVLSTVEEAARSGAIPFVVCTPTLADGVDLPVRTVIVAGTRLDQNTKLGARKIDNLAGRAGRAGRFRDGTVLIRASNESEANQLRAKLFGRIPPTKSALFALLAAAANIADEQIAHQQWTIPDVFLLETLADVALQDHELLERFEHLLGRTLWRAQAQRDLPGPVAAALVRRAHWIQAVAPEAQTRQVYQRTGLPFARCSQITELLRDDAVSLVATVHEPETRASLVAIATDVLWEHQAPISSIDADRAATLATEWAEGAPEHVLMHGLGADAWSRMRDVLDRELPWYLSGVVELLAHATAPGHENQRSDLQNRFETARYRYGAPSRGCCNLIRSGHDRQLVLDLLDYANSNVDATWWQFTSSTDWFEAFARNHLEQHPNGGDHFRDFVERRGTELGRDGQPRTG